VDEVHSNIPKSTQRKKFTKEHDYRKICDWMISNKRFLFNDFARFDNIILTKYIYFNLYNKLFLYQIMNAPTDIALIYSHL